uniref:aminotransferase class I/II-fold pyridoxal phosphate-dependent enzyme n=1 Tax=uncultured Arthrobacter sp. TaxID=114050 RepID=UPI0025E15B5B
MGNGVSDLILMSLQAILDDGDEVLVPCPDYPLWTAGVTLAGGTAVPYPCDESAGWLPDVKAMARAVTPRTRAVVIINPNNPTGALYPASLLGQIAEVARRANLTILSDEIYDQVLYDGQTHVATAVLAPDVTCLTFNGLSKAYLLAGYRGGWLTVTGPRAGTAGTAVLRSRLDVLAGMRLGANVPGQLAVEVALSGEHGVRGLVLPGGRLCAQRDAAHEALTSVPGVTCVRPQAGLYAFPKLDRSVWGVEDDASLVFDVLVRRGVLLSPGSSFNWPGNNHLRVVTLATETELRWAAEQLRIHVAERRRGGSLSPRRRAGSNSQDLWMKIFRRLLVGGGRRVVPRACR